MKKVRSSLNLGLNLSLSRTAILLGGSPLAPDVQAIEVLLCQNGFPAACYATVWDLMTASRRFKLSG